MSITSVIDDFDKLNNYEQKKVYDIIYSAVNNSSNKVSDYLTEIREARFAKGTYCPHCKGTQIIGHGKYRSRQRYKCKDCGKTFNDPSCSPMAGTHYPDKWGKYIKFVSMGTTLPKIVKELKISLSTAFYWRHKVINSLRTLGVEQLSGIVESDETFFLESMKGKQPVTNRKPHKRGAKSKFRGISHEQVCVLVAMDRNGHMLSQKAGMGRVTAKQIDAVIGNNIAPDSMLCSDSARNYIYYAKLKGLKHETVNIRQKKYVVKDLYHIQHVNSYHERIGTWINRHFRGVSTKHIDNYLYWHRFLELHKSLDKNELKKTLLTQVLATNKATTVKDLRPKKIA